MDSGVQLFREMAVSISVNQVGTSNTLNIQLDLGDAADQVTRENQEYTTAALFGFMEERARTDVDLREDEAQCIRLRQDNLANNDQQRNAELVGRRIREMGDEFMVLFAEPDMADMAKQDIEDSDGTASPQRVFLHFCEVVNNVFECDENGVARKINLGRIAGVFSYCYYLCKTFIQKYAYYAITSLLGLLAGYLIRCLFRARFYDWLAGQGGWSHLKALTELVLPGLSANTLYLTGAVILFGLWAYGYFFRR